MRFRSLGSGSSGNATLIEARDGVHTTRVLVDAGFSVRELTRRLAMAGAEPQDIDAIFVTHEHADHIGCALAFRRRHGTRLCMSRGTWAAVRGSVAAEEAALDEAQAIEWARDGQPIAVGALQLHPYTVPHDAREPLQLRCTDGRRSLGLLTDAGCGTAHLLAALRGLDALLLECNHDPTLLAACAYPASVKARIGGRLGHLANEVAADILRGVAHPGLGHVVAAHLSERNNRPELAAAALASALGTAARDVLVATPETGTPWLGVG